MFSISTMKHFSELCPKPMVTMTNIMNITNRGEDTDHSSELVKFWLEVGSPEVDISSFVSHLITEGRQNTKQNI